MLFFFLFIFSLLFAEEEFPAIKKNNSKPSKEKKIEFCIAPLCDVAFGTLGEYVFSENVYGEEKKLSQLNWDTNPVLSFGINCSVLWKWLVAEIYARGAIPMQCGKMDDSDWLDLDDVKNIYSVSDNFCASSFGVGANFSFLHKRSENFFIGAFLGIDFSYIAFESKNGYGWYGDSYWGGKGYNIPYYEGTYHKIYSIDYTRYTLSLWLGTTMKIVPTKKFSFQLSFAISPYSYIFSIDHHHNRIPVEYFLDILHGVFAAFKPSCRFDFFVTPAFSITLNGSWRVSDIVRGNSYYSYTGKAPWYKQEARGGMSFNQGSVSLSGTYRIKF